MTYQQLRTPARVALAASILCGLLASRSVHSQPETPAALEPYVGSYEISDSEILTISLEGDSLYAATTGQPRHRLVPISQHLFSDKVSGRELQFAVGSDGRASSVTQRLDGATQVAERTEKRTPDSPAQTDAAGRTGDPAVLADAVRARDLDAVRKLVEQGADIHGLDTRPGIAGGNGRRPLNFAALNNDTAMIELLLELGADINRQNLSGFTPLHHAVEVEAIEAIALLLSKGADTTIENGRNLTPAKFAVASRRSRAAAALGAVQAE